MLSEKVRDIKVRQVGGSQVSFQQFFWISFGFLLDFLGISSGFPLNILSCLQVGDKNHAYIVDSEVVRPIAMEVA